MFGQFGSETGSEEHNFQNRYKHSVLFPRLLELLKMLNDRCNSAQTTVDAFLESEEKFEHKPRWSKGDQDKYGEQLKKNRESIKSHLAEIKEVKDKIKVCMEWFTNLKEWIARLDRSLVKTQCRRSPLTSAVSAQRPLSTRCATFCYSIRERPHFHSGGSSVPLLPPVAR